MVEEQEEEEMNAGTGEDGGLKSKTEERGAGVLIYVRRKVKARTLKAFLFTFLSPPHWSRPEFLR